MLERQQDKLEVVVSFLAILELMKIGKIHLTQEHTFDDMWIETLEQEGEEGELELEDLSGLKDKYMGNFLEEDDDDPVDLAAVEARHAEMEAEAECRAAGDRIGIQPGRKQQKTGRPSSRLFCLPWAIPVELKQLAVAIGQSEDIAKRVVLHLQKRYEEEKRGMRILELENAYQMCT